MTPRTPSPGTGKSAHPAPLPGSRPPLLEQRGRTLVLLALCGLAGALFLGLSPAQLLPSPGRLTLAREFLAGALQPSFPTAPTDSGSSGFLSILLAGLGRTISFAAAATGLSVLCAVPLGLCASRSLGRGASWTARPQHQFLPALRSALRLGLAAMRSVHELLWAVLFLAALGLSDLAAVIAIAIPYTGTLAKVFAEFLDEASLFLVGRLPRALPDMAAYAFYRFECAIRSAAILGFFGYPTLGYHLKNAFDALDYGEVWAWLYALLALVLLLEAWSSALRRRFVA